MEFKVFIASKHVVLIAFWAVFSPLYAQKIDSLQKLLANKNLPDTSKVLAMNELAIEYRNINPDTCFALATQALKLSEFIQFSKGQGTSYRVLGIYYLVKKDYPQALFYYQKALPYIQKTNNLKDIAWTYVNIGTVYRNQGNQQVALEYYFKALQSFEKINEYKGTGWVYNNIGEIYKAQFNYEKALEYHQKSLSMREKVGDKQDIALSYFNVGIIYQLLKQFDQALDFLSKSLAIREQIKDNRGIVLNYVNIADIYIHKKDFPQALENLYKGQEIVQKAQIKDKIPELNITLANYYNRTQNPTEAFHYAEIALQDAQKIGNVEYIQAAAQQYSLAAVGLGKYKEAYQGLALFKQMSDSSQNAQNQKLAIQREYQYREDRQKLEQDKKNLAHQAELERERLILYATLSGLVLMLALAFFAFRSYRVKQKANILLAQQQKSIIAQNELLQVQKDEILVQNEELQQQQEEILTQREVIEQRNLVLAEQNQQIQNSIKAAKIIQTAILSFESRMKQLLKEFFLIFRPRDVVSGDFYWLNQRKNKILLAVADCTGHGVPGAFMSMIGHTSLERIVDMKQIEEPAQILEALNQDIVYVLKQEESKNNNGMDIGIVSIEAINEQNIRVVFAGAKRPLYYINCLENKGLQKIEGTRKSIGGFQNTQICFEQTEVTLPKGSLLYLSTDGYKDQNDIKRKRFGEENLIRLINSSYTLSLDEQKTILEQALDKHQQNTTQRDDILLLGVRL